MVSNLAVDPLQAPTRVFAITSGKGGVGKTMVSINLSVALAQAGHRVTLLDADLGLANADVLLGLSPKQNLADVLAGRCELQDILLEGPAGIKLVPAASGLQHMAELGASELGGLMHAFSHLGSMTDIMVIDTAAGIASNALHFCDASQEVLVVVCNEPASITDAYATIKVLNQRTGRSRFRIVANRVSSEEEGKKLFQNLVNVTDRFLDVALDFSGSIELDAKIPMAARRRKCLVEAYPESSSAKSLKKLARMADNWPIPRKASGKLEFFLERMIETEALGRQLGA